VEFRYSNVPILLDQLEQSKFFISFFDNMKQKNHSADFMVHSLTAILNDQLPIFDVHLGPRQPSTTNIMFFIFSPLNISVIPVEEPWNRMGTNLLLANGFPPRVAMRMKSVIPAVSDSMLGLLSRRS
jgi:hypothetical protein